MKRSLQSLLVLLACSSLAAYFGYHVIAGKYGLEAQSGLREGLAIAKLRREGLEAVRATLKRDIALLTQSPPDRDLIEETAQSTLGFAYPGDSILRTDLD